MQAVILAAGMGKRLGELTSSNTKCMIQVNGVPLIERMLGHLDRLMLDRIIIVTGYERENLVDFISSLSVSTPIEYVTNDIYDRTNNIYSLFLAKDFLTEDDTLLLESDLIFEFQVLKKLVDNPYPNLALVARFQSRMNGTVVTIDANRNITRFIDKAHFSFDEVESYYKTVNIYKFSREFLSTHYVPFLEAYCKAQGNNEYYEQVLRVISLIDKSALKALPLQEGELWYEIDDIQDLDIAESIFSQDPMDRIAARYGGFWRYPHLLDFCYLVNPYFPGKTLLNEMKNYFTDLVTRYPSGRKVNNLLASRNFGVKAQYISTGNGAAELIKILMDQIGSGRTGFIFPTFEEYPNRGAKSGSITFVPDNPDFRYSADDVISFFSDKGISSMLIINPDNPSGNFIPKEDLLRLCSWSLKNGIRLTIDESFVDFSNESSDNTLIDNTILETYPNLSVIKSISKSFGVAGLRLGVLASSDTALIEKVNEEMPIWNINSFAEFYMQIFKKYENEYKDACRLLISERERFHKELMQIDFLKVIPSQGNYFLCEVINGHTSSEVAAFLFRHKILVKDCSRKKGFGGGNYIRIAIRDTKDNDTLINTLKLMQC